MYKNNVDQNTQYIHIERSIQKNINNNNSFILIFFSFHCNSKYICIAFSSMKKLVNYSLYITIASNYLSLPMLN